MTHPGLPSGGGSGRDGVGLRLLWPQWQGWIIDTTPWRLWRR